MKRFLVLVFLLASGRLTGTAWSSDGGVPPALFATDEARFGDAEEGEGAGYRVEPVVVQATRIGSDKNTVAGRELEMMPSATGSITEALKGMSQVQFSNERQSSRTLGEIAPPRISIFGAKPYENNFLIDGMNVTNTLNPSGFDDSAGPNDLMVGGGDSTIFYDTHLVESITVHSSNVPAEFGGFLGGAVDAKLRDPRADRWYFTVSGRYTEDGWFKLRDVDQESELPDNQPRFSIYQAAVTAEGPLTDNAAILLSASRRQSRIPLKRSLRSGLTLDDDQRRGNDNYFARLLLTPTAALDIKLDATYAPYEELRWRRSWPDSDWKIENRSWRFAGQAEYRMQPGLLDTKVAIARHGFSRDSAGTLRESLTNLGDSSQNDQRGGVGDADITTKEIQAAASFKSNPLRHGNVRWHYALGLEFAHRHTDSWNEAATSDTLVLARPVAVPLPSTLISTRTIANYPEVTQAQHMSSYGTYLQGEMVWRRLMLTPGMRVDYDSFSENLDVAPRFKLEVDVLGTGEFRIIGGANRYYGQQLRGYAFRRHRPYSQSQTRVLFGGSEVTTFSNQAAKNYRSDGLDTPYSDELMGGVAGTVAGFDYSLEFVHRKHQDQIISQTEDNTTYYLTNNGRSSFDGLTFTLGREWRTAGFGHHVFALSATKSRTQTFNGSYFSQIFVDSLSNGFLYNYDKVFYNGSYISRSGIPAEDFNAPLVLALTVGSNFFGDRLRLQSVTRWRDNAKGLLVDARISDDTPYGTTSGRNDRTSSQWINADGGYSDAYKKGSIAGGLVTDLTVEVDAVRHGRYGLTLIAEVFNLFNSSMETSVAEGGARISGRGFYAGLRASF